MKTKMFLLIFAAPLLSACPDQGPLERAGEEIDEGIEDARAGGETLENSLDDAADDVRDAADEVADEIGN